MLPQVVGHNPSGDIKVRHESQSGSLFWSLISGFTIRFSFFSFDKRGSGGQSCDRLRSLKPSAPDTRGTPGGGNEKAAVGELEYGSEQYNLRMVSDLLRQMLKSS
jgi:hypothetical protein